MRPCERSEREYGRKIAGRYHRDYHGSTIMRAWDREFAEFVRSRCRPGDRVLDLGCGPASLWDEWREVLEAPKILVGLDLSESLLAAGKSRHPRAGLVAGSVLNLPFAPGSFDRVVLSSCLHHLPDALLPIVWSEVHAVLDEHGSIVGREPSACNRLAARSGFVSGALMNFRHMVYRRFHVREIPEPKIGDHHHAYDAKEFMATLQRRFRVEAFEYRHAVSAFVARANDPQVARVVRVLDRVAGNSGSNFFYAAHKNYADHAAVAHCVAEALKEAGSERGTVEFLAYLEAASRLLEEEVGRESRAAPAGRAAAPMPPPTMPADPGRRIRVLHIGNIANNAYNNAKLLTRYGIDCDVLCHDYYHIMGCPEWEDGRPRPERIPDPDFPPPRFLKSGGFRRPKWFAQGPLPLCVEYLIARRRGHRIRAALCWALLEGSRVLLAIPGFGRWVKSVREGAHEVYAEATGWVVRALVRALRKVLPSWARRRWKDPERPNRDHLLREFALRFPDRADALEDADLDVYGSVLPQFRRLFRHYDLVQAYSTDPIYPMLLGFSPYVAFEHGTLRAIPQETTPRGRLTSLAYSMAGHVLVTNADCLPAAARLAPGRFTRVNHPLDENRTEGTREVDTLRRRLQGGDSAARVFFYPTRHDWVPGTGFADKANDRFFSALAGARARGMRECRVICCRWGANVTHSRALIEKLGLENWVGWVDPLPVRAFEQVILASDYVVDQFVLGALGGVAIKAMAAGRPVISYLSPESLSRLGAAAPPILNAHREAEIRDALLSVSRETPQEWEARCHAARCWAVTHHSGEETARVQLDLYRRLLSRGASSRTPGAAEGS